MSKADSLFSKIEQGDAVYTAFSNRLKTNFLIYDKTMEEWWKHFGIRIETDNLNPETCRQLDAQIANLYQEASFWYSRSMAETHALESGRDSSHSEKYAAIVAQFKEENPGAKIPAASTIEMLAKNEEDEIYSAISIAKISKDFWNIVLKSLDTCRKLVENASINNSIEAKLNGKQFYHEDK